jgi:hypothetical protein
MAHEIDSTLQNILKMKFEHIPEQTSSLVRLFLSSTTSGEFLNSLRILNSSFLYSFPQF